MNEAFPFDGVRHDLEIWSLLADEWKRTRLSIAPAQPAETMRAFVGRPG